MAKWYEHPVVVAIGIITGGCLISEHMAQKHQEHVNDQRMKLAEMYPSIMTELNNSQNDEEDEKDGS